MSIADKLFNAPTGAGTSLVGVSSPFFDVTLPRVAQVAGAVYLLLLLIHKVWKMWKEWKGTNNESEE